MAAISTVGSIAANSNNSSKNVVLTSDNYLSIDNTHLYDNVLIKNDSDHFIIKTSSNTGIFEFSIFFIIFSLIVFTIFRPKNNF